MSDLAGYRTYFLNAPGQPTVVCIVARLGAGQLSNHVYFM
jgi:hypothetical protein